jgi:hypothetical protein
MSFSRPWHRLLRRNPVLARELRLGLRTGRLLFLLVATPLLIAMLMLGLIVLLKATRSPGGAGSVAFQIFFSLAYFVVALVAPTLAALDFASERDSRTWDCLIMTPLDLRSIARGKFWANAAAMSTLVAMMAPLALLCPLLGGATMTEVGFALMLLVLVAAVSVAFGCAVGAFSRGAGSAILASLGSSLLAAPLLYVGAGIGLSFLAHGTWPRVPRWLPVWLPLAYARAPVNGFYVILLLVVPCAITLLALWFFYQLTLAGLRDEADDRATGLKCWYLASLPIVAAIAAIPGTMTRGSARLGAWLIGLGGLFFFLIFAAFVLAGDAWEPSPRVVHRWEQRKSLWLPRVLGPGLVQTSMLLLVSGLLTTAMYSLIGAAALSYSAVRGLPPAPAVSLLLCGEAWGAFFVFLVGFLLWARARSGSTNIARVLSLLVSGVALAAPWIVYVAANYGGDRRAYDVLLLASPSPLYALAVVNAILRGEPHLAMVSTIACSLGWVLFGMVLLGLGARRATHIVAVRRSARANLEANVFAELGRAPSHG